MCQKPFSVRLHQVREPVDEPEGFQSPEVLVAVTTPGPQLVMRIPKTATRPAFWAKTQGDPVPVPLFPYIIASPEDKNDMSSIIAGVMQIVADMRVMFEDLKGYSNGHIVVGRAAETETGRNVRVWLGFLLEQ
jgi:hypothetical protein